MHNWPFDQAPNCGTPISRSVLEGKSQILAAYHLDDDHSWMFLDCELTEDTDPESAALVCLSHVLNLDESVAEIADLPPGWYATRDAIGTPWKKHKSEADEESSLS
jgi:hypothetical protein